MGVFLLSSFLVAFIPLLNKQAHFLYYTCFPSEVKNCIACITEDRKMETKGWAESEEMKNKKSNEDDSESCSQP